MDNHFKNFVFTARVKGGIKSACLCCGTSNNTILLFGVHTAGDLHSIYLTSRRELGLICKVHEIFTTLDHARLLKENR
ncbi:mCG1035885 [Mus musculus]|nr:mCG1035885 [Mus musculus]